MMYALKYVGVLRVSKEGELEGLDIHEHGASAYPEYALAVAGSSNGHNGLNGHAGTLASVEPTESPVPSE